MSTWLHRFTPGLRGDIFISNSLAATGEVLRAIHAAEILAHRRGWVLRGPRRGYMRTTHKGRWTRNDRAEEPYRYLDVEVPAGTAALNVALDYDHSDAVLELGLFGPGGFRGWCGAVRSAFVIGETVATPGYLPGPLDPGRWRVMVGLHRIGAGGVDWELTAIASAGKPELRTHAPSAHPPPDNGRPRRRLPAIDGLRWLAGDLHVHSTHSDGALSVEELGHLAQQRGLDFLAITDHNTVSAHAEMPAASARTGVALIAGQEITTPRGHANVLGDVGWIDFRTAADDWLTESDRRGGLLSICHPLAADFGWRQPMARRPRHAEIWHWSWLDRRWSGPLAWWEAYNPHLIPFGGSDFHRYGADALPGAPTTWVGCDASRVDSGDVVGAVLAGLSAGRTAISAGYSDPVVVRVGDEVVAIGADGLLLVDSTGRRTPVRGDQDRIPAPPGPCRLEDHDTAVVALAGDECPNATEPGSAA
jgi:PHP domain